MKADSGMESETESLNSSGQHGHDGGDSSAGLIAAGGVLSFLFLLLAFLLIVSVNLGIVYYERVVPDAHRTLINKVAALVSAYNLITATSVIPPLAARYEQKFVFSLKKVGETFFAVSFSFTGCSSSPLA